MATAFGVTTVLERQPLIPGLTIGVYTLQLESSYTAAGATQSIDFTTTYGFTAVYAILQGFYTAASALWGYKLDFTGTPTTPTAVLLRASWAPAGHSAVFDDITATTDLKAVVALPIIVIGK